MHFSPLGTKPCFHVNYSRKKFIDLYCIDNQHGRLVTWLQAENINHPPLAVLLVPLQPPPQAFPRLIAEDAKAGEEHAGSARGR